MGVQSSQANFLVGTHFYSREERSKEGFEPTTFWLSVWYHAQISSN
jgi:hypothetical protein